MSAYLSPLIAGIAGTIVMTVFLLFPRWVGLGNVDVIRAVGSLITGRMEKAWSPGFFIHFASGIIFAYVYKLLLGLAGVPLTMLSGFFAGAIHGAIVMLVVSIAVMEHHPVSRYHERGPMTGVMQLLAHILYGLVVGLVVQVLTPA